MTNESWAAFAETRARWWGRSALFGAGWLVFILGSAAFNAFEGNSWATAFSMLIAAGQAYLVVDARHRRAMFKAGKHPDFDEVP